MLKTLGLTAASVLLAGTASAATLYEYSSTVRPGTSKELSASYSFIDPDQIFGMSFEVDDDSGVDGAWWVVSDGPNPARTGATNMAILYTDLTDIWAYEYTGGYRRNNPGGTGATLLAFYDDVVNATVDGDKLIYSTSIDVTELNSAATAANTSGSDWQGLQFAEKIGTWLHPTINSFAGCADGTKTDAGLTCFNGGNWIGWDETGKTANVSAVPLPAGMGFLLAGLAGLGIFRRKSA